jgi:hypothetical protein
VFLSIRKTTILFRSVISLLTTRDVPKDLDSRVKIQAIKEELTLQALVLKTLEEYLKKVGG